MNSTRTLIMLAAILILAMATTANAQPTNVTIVGDLQDELGCPGDWQPDCASTYLTYDAGDDVWQATFSLPAGAFQYKATLNNAWDENYGANAQAGGANIPLNLGDATAVKFYYDDKTHWITDNVNSVIATAVGDFQSEIGCAGDWDPSCLHSWMQDPDGDGVYTYSTDAIPPGGYEAKVVINEAWDESYPGGNVSFTVTSSPAFVTFSYDSATNIVAIDVQGDPPPEVASVTIAGSLQSELGCPSDWQPDCALTHLTFETDDDVWQGTFSVPAGAWEYKAALNDNWTENYGANAQMDGANISLTLGTETPVKFYYDHKNHWATDNVNSVIATAVGDFQSEVGCAGDWDPSCLRSWLQDPDGDGIYTFFTTDIPAGMYEAKAAINESWDESYGVDGVPGGANIPFVVPVSGMDVLFSYDAVTHILSITAEGTVAVESRSWGGVKALYR
jgi:pullulanase